MVFVALGLAYGLAVYPALSWVYNEISRAERFMAVACMTVSAGIIIWRFGLPTGRLDWKAAVLLIVCAWASRFSFHILQQLSASIALLGIYALFQPFERVSPALWRQGFIMAALGALAIPFALVPGTGAGFYLRLLTADASAFILSVLGHSSLGAHDVLIFDNGIAQVDIPCSGLKSLFTGTAFFLAASLVLRRPISMAWMLAYGAFVTLLLTANVMRVTALIWMSEIMEARSLAETLHTAIGLGLFALCCIAGILMLRQLKAYEPSSNPRESKTRQTHLLSGLAIGLASLAIVLVPLKSTVWDGAINAPGQMQLTDIGLTPTETQFFAARGNSNARKWQFEHDGISGSMLVVKSRAANGLHAPEVCLLGNGLTIEHMQTTPWQGESRFRWLSVNEGRYSAAYWMQSGDLVTEDFRERLSQYILGRHNEWIMVTLLFDQSLTADTLSDENTPAGELMVQLRQFYDTRNDGASP